MVRITKSAALVFILEVTVVKPGSGGDVLGALGV